MSQSILETLKNETVNNLVEEWENCNAVISGNLIEVSSEVSLSTSEVIDISRQHTIEECVKEQVIKVKDDKKHSEKYIEALQTNSLKSHVMEDINDLKNLETLTFATK